MKQLFSNSSHGILSLIVAAAIILSCIPLSAAAESENAATSGVTQTDDIITDDETIAEDEPPVATPATTAAPIGIAPMAAGTPITDTSSLNAAIADFNSGSADMTIEIAANFTTDSVTAITAINNSTAAQKLTITSIGGIKKITRGKTGDLITVTKGELILDNIIIDGDNSNPLYVNSFGSLVTVAANGAFTMKDGTTRHVYHEQRRNAAK